MKRSRYSPASASMICSSRPVPSVTVTSAWVSPRVNSAEPWVRGRTPTRQLIGRTVRVSRPSMRGSPSRIWLRGRPAFSADADGLEHALPERVDGLRACLLLLEAERFAQLRLGKLLDPG